MNVIFIYHHIDLTDMNCLQMMKLHVELNVVVSHHQIHVKIKVENLIIISMQFMLIFTAVKSDKCSIWFLEESFNLKQWQCVFTICVLMRVFSIRVICCLMHAANYLEDSDKWLFSKKKSLRHWKLCAIDQKSHKQQNENEITNQQISHWSW